jgi:hypothetical protein
MRLALQAQHQEPTTSDAGKHQFRKLNHFLNSPLQFFAFIWYKQFTESKVWQSGIFV